MWPKPKCKKCNVYNRHTGFWALRLAITVHLGARLYDGGPNRPPFSLYQVHNIYILKAYAMPPCYVQSLVCVMRSL